MRKVLMCMLCAVVFVFSLHGEAQAGRIRGTAVLRLHRQHIFFPLRNVRGKLYIPGFLIRNPRDVLATRIVRATWNSDRVFWEETSHARSVERIIYLDPVSGLHTLIFEIEHTFDSDRGNWILWRDDGKKYWVNPRAFMRTGFRSAIEGDLLRYGDYLKPHLSINSGFLRMEFNTNGIIGFNRFINDPKEISFIRWESDEEGWGSESNRKCVPQEIRENHRFYCVISGLEHQKDRGNLHLFLKDGHDAWMTHGMWTRSPNIRVNPDSTISYDSW